jgi:hypothetical protein
MQRAYLQISRHGATAHYIVPWSPALEGADSPVFEATKDLPADPAARDVLVEFGSLEQAAPYLRRVAGNLQLRMLVSAFGGLDLPDWQDEDVVTYVARQLVAGKIALVKRIQIREVAGTEGAPDPGPVSAPPPRVAAPPPAPKASQPEPDTFQDSLAVEHQVAVLIAAAESGVPFCEECARAAGA